MWKDYADKFKSFYMKILNYSTRIDSLKFLILLARFKQNLSRKFFNISDKIFTLGSIFPQQIFHNNHYEIYSTNYFNYDYL